MSEKFTTNILDLNENCLIEICKFLGANDLLALYEAHPHPVLYNPIKFVISKIKINFYRIKQIENFCKIFRNQFSNIRIDIHIPDLPVRSARELLINNYKNGYVEHLEIGCHILTQKMFKRNLLSLKSLKSFRSWGIDSRRTFTTMLKDLKDISSLYICDAKFVFGTDLLKNIIHCHHLESLSIDTKQVTFKSKQCVRLNFPSIKHFKLMVRYNKADLSVILKHFPNIQTFNLEQNCRAEISNMHEILNLSKLKDFSVCCFNDRLPLEPLFSVISKLAEINALDSFELKIPVPGSKINGNLIHVLCKMSNLKTLKLHASSSFNIKFIKIAEKLKNLQEFEFYSSYNINKQYNKAVLLLFALTNENVRKLNFYSCNFEIPSIEDFYDQLVVICQSGKNKRCLNVTLYDDKHIKRSKSSLYTNKLVNLKACELPLIYGTWII